jgi:uncharacterized protein YbjT (DUF2867 family)
MKVVLFGASGMIGQGVLRECLLDDAVESVLAVVRSPLGVDHPRLREAVHADFSDFSPLAGEFADADACFFCLGVSATGKCEEEYRKITYDWTLAAAHTFTGTGNDSLTFVYVSGAGTDSTERGRTMWARVKGRTENALLAMPFHAYMVRPGYIQPLHGATSRTPAYRRMYAALSWLYPLLRRIMPGQVTTTESLGRAMLAVARWRGGGEHILHSREINAAAAATTTA